MAIKQFTISSFIKRSLRNYWRIQLSVMLAAAVGVAVLTGSLLVGDSMRHSLRAIVLEALGDVDNALVYDLFFNENLTEKIEQDASGGEIAARGVVFQRGTVSNASTEARAGQVQVLGVDGDFWKFGEVDINWDEIDAFSAVINQTLADEIGVSEGDDVILRIQKPSAVPRETFLGEKDDTVITMRQTVKRILPDSSLGRFSLRPSQQRPMNLFIPKEEIQARMEREGMVNAIFASGSDTTIQEALVQNADMENAGIILRETDDYFVLESRRVFMGDYEQNLASDATKAVRAETRESLHPDRVLSYLANGIAIGDKSIPYSMAASIQSAGLKKGEISLTQWAADDLGAKPGDTVTLTYFATGEGGLLVEKSSDFTLKEIIPMDAPLLDRAVTPHIEGVSDADTVASWDPPFPLDLRRIREKDEKYWDDYRTLPKGFVSMTDAKNMWANRYGDLTSIIWEKQYADAIRSNLRKNFTPASAGMVFEPVKQQGLDASSGTTDFGGLFIGFSLFLLISAAALLQVLFKLGIESRSRELGLLLSVGFRRGRARRLLLTEGGIVALGGGVLGIIMGLGYAAVLVYGLNNWWVGSIGGSFLEFAATPVSLGIGFVGGWIIAMISMWIATRILVKIPERSLLAGRTEQLDLTGGKRRVSLWVGFICVISGLGLLAPASWQPAHSQAAFFFIIGALLLVGALAFFRYWLGGETGMKPEKLSLARLGATNTKRQAGRSLMVAALVASATFLIVAVGSNRQVAHKQTEKDSGTGGFALIGESAFPLHRAPLKSDWQDDAQKQMVEENAEIFTMRLRPGDEISCLNLYAAHEPRIVGVSDPFIERGGFNFSGVIDASAFREGSVSEADLENPWALLNKPLKDGSIPAIGDYTTVYWLLHLGIGKSIEVGGKDITIVAMLQKSVLQNELMISEKNFEAAYAAISGWSVFAVEAPFDQADAISQALEAEFTNYGLDLTGAPDKLNALMQVENTYLSTFMSLGGLGLLLGTIGLGLALLRNLIERRREFALFSALGYRFSQRMWLAMTENGFLLAAGMGFGTICAIISIAPSIYMRSARIPWEGLVVILLGIYACGLLTTWLSAFSVLRSPVVRGLKEEQ
ncbi:MAG: FtsX-like permease family protein [Candidatus Sumerlaeia bacterium]